MSHSWFPNSLQPVPIPQQQFSPFQNLTQRNADEIQHNLAVNKRINDAVARDVKATQVPDTSPFKSDDDFLKRMLAYHIWQYPEEDMERIMEEKRKAIEAHKCKREERLSRARNIYSRYAKFRASEEKARKEKEVKKMATLAEDPPPVPPSIPKPVPIQQPIPHLPMMPMQMPMTPQGYPPLQMPIFPGQLPPGGVQYPPWFQSPMPQ